MASGQRVPQPLREMISERADGLGNIQLRQARTSRLNLPVGMAINRPSARLLVRLSFGGQPRIQGAPTKSVIGYSQGILSLPPTAVQFL